MRNIKFTLTFPQFLRLIKNTNYVNAVGCSTDSLHIDRREADKGYTFKNCRVLKASRNIAKGNRERHGYVNPEDLEDDPY